MKAKNLGIISGIMLFFGSVIAASTLVSWNPMRFIVGQMLNGWAFLFGIISFSLAIKERNLSKKLQLSENQIIPSNRRVEVNREISPAICDNCGSIRVVSDNFCQYCGTALAS